MPRIGSLGGLRSGSGQGQGAYGFPPIGQWPLICHGDIELNGFSLKFSNMKIEELDTYTIGISNLAGTAYRNLKVSSLYWQYYILPLATTSYIRTKAGATNSVVLQSHNGSAFVDNLKLQGGIVEINAGKLTSALDCNNQLLNNFYKDEGDYGGGFSNYTPPTVTGGAIVLARDTNATTPGWRLYVKFSDGWHYVDLT